MPPFVPIGSYRTLFTHIGVGMGAASFWRGAWYVLDDNLFPDNQVASAGASLGLGTLGMAASQGLVAKAEAMSRKRPLPLAMARFGAIYTVAMSCVLVWRGTWVAWDCLDDSLHDSTAAASSAQNSAIAETNTKSATKSGIVSHVVSVALLLTSGLFASVLGPPAAVSVIRDWSVRSSASGYQGPAQKVVDQMFRRSSSPALAATRQSSTAARKMVRPAARRTYAAARKLQTNRFHHQR